MREGGRLENLVDVLPQMRAAFERNGVVLAFLYGSQATGLAGALSDVDIAVLFGRNVPEHERLTRLLALMGDLGEVLRRDDVSVLDLDRGTPLLNNNVRMQGRLLYCSDERMRADFMLRALQEYEDTEPMRRVFNHYLGIKIKRGLFGKPIPIERKR